MRTQRRLGAILLAAGVAASGLVAGGAGASAAAVAEPPAAASDASLSAANDSTALTPAQKIDCKVQIQNPHNSSHVRGTVNVVTTVKCSASVASISLDVELFHNGRRVDNRAFHRVGVSSLKGNAAHACSSGSYQGKAQVTVVFPPGYKPPTASGGVASKTVGIHC